MSPLSVGRSGSCFVAPWSRCRYCDCESGSLADGRTERPLEAPLATTIPCGSSRRRRPVRRWAARPVMPRSARLSRLRIPIPERRAWRPLSFALAPSETERSSADEDDDAEADQDDGEQDVFPALEDFSDRRPGGNELGDYDQDRDEREEDEAVGDHCDGFHAEEDGDIDADVVSAVGEGDSCDGPRADLRARDLGVIVVIVSAPGLPCSPETEGQGDEPEVRDSC